MKSIKKLGKILLDQLESDDYDIDAAQDMRDTAIENAEDVLKSNGYTQAGMSEEDWDELVSELADQVMFVPAHWAKPIKRRK